MTTYHIDPINGDDSNDGSTWALAKKFPVVADGALNKIAKTPIHLIGDAQWTQLSNEITLAVPAVATIDEAVGNTWSGATGVTMGSYSVRKLGASCQSIYCTTSHNTASKAAWKTLPSTLDLSSFTKISLWLQASHIANYNSKQLKICLCSDSNGDTIVNEFILGEIYVTNRHHAMTLDYGGALGSNINSIAIYANAAAGVSVYVRVNNIIACNNLSLNSIISKNEDDTEDLIPIQNITNGDTISIDIGNVTFDTAAKYCGSTELTTLYARNGDVRNQTVSSRGVFYDAAAPSVHFIGGYNTSTDLADGITWYDGACYYASLSAITNGGADIIHENIGAIRYATAFAGGTTNQSSGSDNIYALACYGDSAWDAAITLRQAYLKNIYVAHCFSSGGGVKILSHLNENVTVKNIKANAMGYVNYELTQGYAITRNMDIISTGGRLLHFELGCCDGLFENCKTIQLTGSPSWYFASEGHVFKNCEFWNFAKPGAGMVWLIDCTLTNALGSTTTMVSVIDTVLGTYKVYKRRTTAELTSEGTTGSWFITGKITASPSTPFLVTDFSEAYTIAEIAALADSVLVVTILYKTGGSAPANFGRLFVRKLFSPVLENVIETLDQASTWTTKSITIPVIRNGVVRVEVGFDDNNYNDIYIERITVAEL